MKDPKLSMKPLIQTVVPSVACVVLIVCLGILPNRASAQDGIGKRFDLLDANGDAKITSDELQNKEFFQRLDLNSDGEITKAEAARALISGRLSDLLKRGGKENSDTPSISEEDVRKITSGPTIEKPGDAGIGRMIHDVDFVDLNGNPQRLSELAAPKGLVIAMTSATCPVSKRYLPSLAALMLELDESGLKLLLVNPFASDKRTAIEPQLAAQNLNAIYVHDKDKKIAAALEARTTTEVFLLDAKRTLIYRGALDDQYGINYNLDQPRKRFLIDAVHAFLKNEPPRIAATAAPGCELDVKAVGGADDAKVTYFGDIARILQQNCVECHREGGVAPFGLEELDSVQDHASVIQRVVSEGTMPPWFAVEPKDAPENPWANDTSLSERDKADLLGWIDSSDRPIGNPSDAPNPRTYPMEWSIGQPDMVLTLSKAFDIKATGYMPYQFDVVETELTEDRWVTAYEILPSARDVVHHVIVKVHEKGSAVRNLGEGDADYWAVYVPGNGSHRYPEGFARLIPAGSKVSFQIHYTPSGEAKQERMRMGLVFAKESPSYEVRTVGVAKPSISIPPHEAAHVETKIQPVPFDIPIMSFMPHMHVRGTAFKYEATYPDGRTEVLLDIPQYDFNWQLCYDYKTPKLIPRGSKVKITAVYNNSSSNPANPDPSKSVKWGPQTIDEMMIGYVDYFVPVKQ